MTFPAFWHLSDVFSHYRHDYKIFESSVTRYYSIHRSKIMDKKMKEVFMKDNY